MTIQTFTAGQKLTATQMNTLQNSDFNFTSNVRSDSSYTFVLSDRGKLVESTYASAATFTIPTNASVAFTIGDTIDVILTSDGSVAIVPAGGVTLFAEGDLTTISSKWTKVTLIKRATNSWVMTGGGQSVQTVELDNLSVTTAKIADSAVTSAKLADATIDEKVASYSLVLADKNKFIKMNIASTANTVTVPTNASVAFPTGSQIHIIQYGTGKTQVIPVSGTVILYATPGAYLRAQYSSATLLKCDTNIWMLMGDLSAS